MTPQGFGQMPFGTGPFGTQTSDSVSGGWNPFGFNEVYLTALQLSAFAYLPISFE